MQQLDESRENRDPYIEGCSEACMLSNEDEEEEESF